MLRRVALVRTDVSEQLSNSETSVLTRATRRNITGDAIPLEIIVQKIFLEDYLLDLVHRSNAAEV
jgi:hypothetical protein